MFKNEGCDSGIEPDYTDMGELRQVSMFVIYKFNMQLKLNYIKIRNKYFTFGRQL